MNPKLAKIISVVFHPLLVPTYLFGSLFCFSPDAIGVDMLAYQTRLVLLSFIFVCSFIVPALAIYYLYRAGFVKTLQLETLEDRRLPYLLTAVIYAFFCYFFAKKLSPLSEIAPNVAQIFGSMTVSIMLVGMISLRWQISAHAVGVGGTVGILLVYTFNTGNFQLLFPLLLSILVSGWVIAARLFLNAHTPKQVYYGFLLGLIVGSIFKFIV